MCFQRSSKDYFLSKIFVGYLSFWLGVAGRGWVWQDALFNKSNWVNLKIIPHENLNIYYQISLTPLKISSRRSVLFNIEISLI